MRSTPPPASQSKIYDQEKHINDIVTHCPEQAKTDSDQRRYIVARYNH